MNQVHADVLSLINSSERYYQSELDAICKKIISNNSKRIICVTGPSSSGKTTTSNLIKQKLYDNDMNSITISLDNFYKNRDDIPINEDGSRDLESIDSLDLPSITTSISNLINTGYAVLPIFDFSLGKRSDEPLEISIDDSYILIIEGIHALNPLILSTHLQKYCFKIYISVSSDIFFQNRLLLAARDIRLTRRIIRDYLTRSSNIDFTFNMWDSVCLGEERFIRPFKPSADFTINSMIYYELFVYRDLILPLLKEIPPHSIHYPKAAELIRIYEMLPKINRELVPSISLINEFI